MPKADSDNSTTLSRDTALSNIAVAPLSRTPLIEQPGDVPPANLKERKMKKAALKKASQTHGGELAAQAPRPATASGPRPFVELVEVGADPIMGLLNKYAACTAETIAAHEQYATAEEKVPLEMLNEDPKIKLVSRPERFARSHEEIEAYRGKITVACENATHNNTAEYRAQVIAANTKHFADMHRELDEERARYDAIYHETGYDVALARVKTAFKAERAVLEEIATTKPTTLTGVIALQAFLVTMLSEGTDDDFDVVQAISRNLLDAMATIGRRPIPAVTAYRHFG